MRKRRGKMRVLKTTVLEEEIAIQRLVAKIMLAFDAAKSLVEPHGFSRASVAEVLGVLDLEDRTMDDRMEVIAEIKKVCRSMLKKECPMYPRSLEENVGRIQRLIGLNDVEADVLKISVMFHYSEILDDLSDLLGNMSSARAIDALSKILGHDAKAVRAALSPHSMLTRSGLVTLDRRRFLTLRNKLDLLSDRFADMMINYDGEDLYELFKESIRPVEKGSLGIEDYDYMAKERDTLLTYLQQAVFKKKPGSHVLIYGKPGTGKTELVKALAKELAVELYEVSYADEDDEPIEGKQRIKAFKSAQYLFGEKPVLLLFDEIEDIFEQDMASIFTRRVPTQNHKGWMNRILENAKVPTVWLSNSVRMMDPATLRRFDIVLKMPEPTRSKRRAIAESRLGGLVSEAMIEAVAECADLVPAHITRAASVLTTMEVGGGRHDETARTLLSGTLIAQGYQPLPKPKTNATGSYDPAFVNASENLARLAEGIAQNPNARLCLYGVPGTGKSAFGKWLAKRLDRPCIVKKGSDLLSMWVGGTEANIAEAFEEAEREGAVLIFDEVDSFLQDRGSAQRSWEITQVNEMLTQMESFEGVFIATTNLMDNLDAASLRRFDLKIEFGYMRKEQGRAMLRRVCQTLGFGQPDDESLRIVENIPNLTPGDFAAVMRRHRFSPIASARDLAEKLEHECRLKKDGNDPVMGFVA